ncbi:UbiA prenyltransferase family protein [Streptomyces albipurpureus]|uniref:UbiA prenyltransferase family protein n=1 Tax=Streptomyces albipurpureus TaxID=2897419 RepID=A0ABT0UQ71_9ACTN|nr:UbiA prenyltransferase family protein [Streptomyces sp. CWNU-1]MCM2389513.1 UbiA prenyltransferase family protein [Streptomyces sp. CWNU-1]
MERPAVDIPQTSAAPVRVAAPPTLLTPPAPPAPLAPAIGPRRRPLVDLLALIRPGQWVKNLAVVPLALLDPRHWTPFGVGRILWALAVFTLASAIVYVVNDLADRDRDRLHPTKRHRPLAAGRIGTRGALALAAVLATALTAAVTVHPFAQWWPVAVYLLISLGYSRGLKHVPLLDAFIVASGFVLRLAQGCVALDRPVPDWLAICVFSLCLLLSLGKRRHELTAAGLGHRPALRGYTLAFVDHLVVLIAGLTAMSYLLFLREDPVFAGAAHTTALLSALCAIFGLARYLQVLLVEEGGGNPVRILLRDRATLVNSALWAVLIGTALLLEASPA